MFAIPENGYQTDQNLKGKRHCILVTACNPCLLPAPVYRPNIKDSGPPPLLSDAETVAQWFGQCSVSLSVICSRKLPKVRALYEAANRNHTSADPPVHVQHPRFLVLISESFAEARAALNLPGLAPAQDPVKSLDPNLGASSSSHPVDQPGRKELHVSQENIAPTNLDFGHLHGQKQRKVVLISKIEVYRTTVASSMAPRRKVHSELQH